MRGKDFSLNISNTSNNLEDKKEKEKFQEKEKEWEEEGGGLAKVCT